MSVLFGYNLITPDYSGSTNIDGDYPETNLVEYDHLMWQTRSLDTSESILSADMTSAKSLKILHLNDVNFTKFYLEYSSDGLSWTNILGGTNYYTVSKDTKRNRYNITIDLRSLSFNYRYFRIRIPNQATTDSAAYFRISSICVTDTVIEPSQNISYDYKGSSDYESSSQKFPSGGKQINVLGRNLIWSRTIEWKGLPEDICDVSVDIINAIFPGDPIIFFENKGDSAKGYLCTKEQAFQISNITTGVVAVNSILLTEII